MAITPIRPRIADSGGAIADQSSLWPPQALCDLFFQESTIVGTGVGSIGEIAPQSDRVYLMVATVSASPVIHVAATVRATAVAVFGRPITQAAPLILSWSADGLAVTQRWYIRFGAATTLLMQEILYRPRSMPQVTTCQAPSDSVSRKPNSPTSVEVASCLRRLSQRLTALNGAVLTVPSGN